MTTQLENLSRRRFLQAGAGLTLGFTLPGVQAAGKSTSASATTGFEPNAFLRIGTDNTVTVISKHLEMGQGTYTGLATLVAEELDAAWAQVKVEGAVADAKRYNNLLWGPAQGTGGSTAMANAYTQMREAGATARAMLVNAAARRWKVAPTSLRVAEGVVSHPGSGRKASFGELAEAAAAEPMPEKLTLKEPAQFRLIGKHAPRRDSADKTLGRAQFTQDLHLPGMLVAVVAHPPRFGATVKGFDASAARQLPGVVDVVAVPQGVAVLARDTWSARQGREALQVEWDESAAYKESSKDLLARYQALAQQPGAVARKEGDVAAALAAGKQVLEVAYDFPFLAHAAMEPMNCVVQLKDGGCEVWNGEQLHTGDQYALSALLGLPVDKILIHTLYAGGSFGRRACAKSDYVLEAAHIAKAHGQGLPIKLVWLREDDMRAGYYRPMYHHRLWAALDEAGNISAWQHRLVGQSILTGTLFEKMMVKDGIDVTSVEGAANLPYALPNLRVELHTPADVGVPVLWWRSVGSSHTAFSTETFFDQLARTAGKDPLQLRLSLLEKHPRHTAVLKLLAEKSNWGQPLPAGPAGVRRGRGLALHESFNTVVAQVAEVSIAADGSLKVDKVICAVDCGIAINPDNIRAQVEGGVGFALAAALYGEVSLDEGRVVQGNFDGFQVLRINEMPQVEVHILPSAAPPTGIGEPGVPPLAPAVANAIADATGKRLTRLPFDTAALVA